MELRTPCKIQYSSAERIFFIPYLWVACGLFLNIEHILLLMLICVFCYENDLCKLYTTICTSEEEWITRNKYSFGVKSSCLGQSFLNWSCGLALYNPLYSLSCGYVNTVGWGRGGAKQVSTCQGFWILGKCWEMVELAYPALVLIIG